MTSTYVGVLMPRVSRRVGNMTTIYLRVEHGPVFKSVCGSRSHMADYEGLAGCGGAMRYLAEVGY